MIDGLSQIFWAVIVTHSSEPASIWHWALYPSSVGRDKSTLTNAIPNRRL